MLDRIDDVGRWNKELAESATGPKGDGCDCPDCDVKGIGEIQAFSERA
jgi:hypothetical protein